MVIVASGPSAKTIDFDSLRSRINVAVINESYRLCPWADVLYACDPEWWRQRADSVKKFSGLKIGFGSDPVPVMKNFHRVQARKRPVGYVEDLCFDEPGIIGTGGNSGFQLMNLVAQFGVTGIGLIAYDMNLTSGVHWHGNHPAPLRNPDESRFKDWGGKMDRVAPALRSHGIDVINCSANSSLRAYPKMTVEAMLERWGL